MKKAIINFFAFLIFLGPATAQNADPFVNITATSGGIVQIGSNTLLDVWAGNFGSDPICINTLEMTITVGVNVEILGIASGDTRWAQTGLTSGPGNTIYLRNLNGGFDPIDFLGHLYLTVKGVVLGGPNNCGSDLQYFVGVSPCTGLPNPTQGNLDGTNDGNITSFTVTAITPLHFTAFTSNSKDCGAKISWSTAQEENIKSFEVQQSFDGNNYTTVGTVLSKGTGANDYSIETNQPQKAMYYRVVAVDIDGRKTYSSTNKVQLSNCQKASMVKVYPIPAFRSQEVTILTNILEKTDYRLFDMNGKLVKSGTFLKTTQFTVATGGTYLLEVSGKDYKESQKIIIQ